MKDIIKLRDECWDILREWPDTSTEELYVLLDWDHTFAQFMSFYTTYVVGEEE